MRYCRNCGKELPSNESVVCPICGVSQNGMTKTVVSIQTKNPGTATVIALIAGVFGFNGLGHIYLGKISFGIGIMIIGWLLAFLTAIGISGIFNNSWLAIFSLVGTGYLIYWLWQAYHANKEAKHYNDYLKSNGKEPW